MTIEYKTLLKPGEEEIVIEKSRFIGYASPVNSEEEALEFIEKIKSRHKDATHNVTAYVVGLHNEIQRYNDDGEPAGTAGVPILEVIKKEDLRNTVIVVTRYFGGIKLGAGGLIRAYTRGAKIAVEAAQVVHKRLNKIFEVVISYTLLGKVQNEIIQNGYLINEIKYDTLVRLFVFVPINKEEQFRKQVMDWTFAKCEINEIGSRYLPSISS
ncbi:MAG: YigZ family protein [Clostridia bacterium]|nr:YigZ family protein [Clostridia bacterium]